MINESELMIEVLREKLTTKEFGELVITVRQEIRRSATHRIGINFCGGVYLGFGTVFCERNCFKANLADPNSIDKFIEWIRFCRRTSCDKCDRIEAK